mgnify:FL=1
MMKKCVALFLALMMALSLTTAVAESDADALDYDELMDWAEGFKTRALAAGAPLNDPTEEAAYTEDGYAFVYDFATLYMDRPEMTADSVLQAVVVYSPEEQGPRGTGVDQLSSEVLNAFYNENNDLQGDSSFAALYVSDTMPAGALWGWVQRDGQRIETIQYAVHEQLSSGGDGYTDCGLVYTLSDNLVAAIRAYGLNETISADEVRSNLDAVQEVSEKTEYAQVPTSINGSELEMFDRDDLIFSGLDFLSLTPEEAEARLGAAQEDDWMEDEGAYLRSMEFASCTMTFSYDAQKQNPTLEMLSIDMDGLEGPRCVRIGDTLSSVISRFRNGEGDYDGVSREVLYGDGENAPYGLAEYGDDATAGLWYATKLEDGRTVVLSMSFEQMYLSDITLYVDN